MYHPCMCACTMVELMPTCISLSHPPAGYYMLQLANELTFSHETRETDMLPASQLDITIPAPCVCASVSVCVCVCIH